MQSFPRLFHQSELVTKHHAFVFFSFLQDSGVRAWASYDHESRASGLRNKFTHWEAKKKGSGVL
jgi:hypothetical protein